MNKQLKEKDGNVFKDVFPINIIQNIKDGDTGKTLQNILKSFNSIFIEYKNNVEDTRNSIDESIRRKGLWVTYLPTGEQDYITEVYIGNEESILNNWADNSNWKKILNVDYNSTVEGKIPNGIITMEKLSPALQELLKQNNNIINYPDDEDLQADYGYLQFKDRKYNPDLASGKGYKILRKNWLGVNNVLTQDMINEENTIYVIRYDFDLNGKEITIPEGCILQFEGGSLSNGNINCNKNYILGSLNVSNCYNYILYGFDYLNINWFKHKYNNYCDALKLALNAANISNKPIYIPKGIYEIYNIDIIYDNIEIYGDGAKQTILTNPTWGIWNFRSSCNNIHIHHLGCKAIEVTKNTIRTPTEEQDNGSSFILSKGNYCIFNDIYGENIQTIIWLGGDYIKSHKIYNKVYNIESYNTSFAVLSNLQNYTIIENIYGNNKQMIGKKPDGITEYVGPPAHLLYITGTENSQEFIKIHNITCYPANRENGGEVWGCSYKCIKNCDISNVIDYAGGQVFQYLFENNYINNINVIGNNNYKYSILIDGINKNIKSKSTIIIGNNINIKNGIFRIADVDTNINNLNINNVDSNISSSPIILTSKKVINVVLNNINIIGNNLSKYSIEGSENIIGFCNISNFKDCGIPYPISKKFKIITDNSYILTNTNWFPTSIQYPIKSHYIKANEQSYTLTLYKNTGITNFIIETTDDINCEYIYINTHNTNYEIGQIIYIIVYNNKSNDLSFRYRNNLAINDNERNISSKTIYYSKLIMTPIGLKEISSKLLGKSNTNNSNLGTSENRPKNVIAGFYYFDTTLNKPIWKKEDTGTIWVDATGAEV